MVKEKRENVNLLVKDGNLVVFFFLKKRMLYFSKFKMEVVIDSRVRFNLEIWIFGFIFL